MQGGNAVYGTTNQITKTIIITPANWTNKGVLMPGRLLETLVHEPLHRAGMVHTNEEETTTYNQAVGKYISQYHGYYNK